MPDEKKRVAALVPPYHLRWLKVWAWLKGRPPSVMASDIIQARVEANIELIREMLGSRAEDLGMTPEELMNDILGEGDE